MACHIAGWLQGDTPEATFHFTITTCYLWGFHYSRELLLPLLSLTLTPKSHASLMCITCQSLGSNRSTQDWDRLKTSRFHASRPMPRLPS